jgi:hypothetical protein
MPGMEPRADAEKQAGAPPNTQVQLRCLREPNSTKRKRKNALSAPKLRAILKPSARMRTWHANGLDLAKRADEGGVGS